MAKMTRRQFERLSREIDEIEKVKLPEAKQRERKCREAGDLSENEAFDAAKREVEDLKSS